MSKKIVSLALLGITASFGLSMPLSGWQRKAMDDCKKDEKSCKKEADKKDQEACKKDVEACRKNAPKKDLASFESELSRHSRSIYKKFSDDQKRKAMDYADGTKMSPDDAVGKVESDRLKY